MAREDFEVVNEGLGAVFSALGDEDAKRFVFLLTGRHYDYTAMRDLFLPDGAGLTIDEFCDKYMSHPIPDDWPAVGSALPQNAGAASKKAAAASTAKSKPAPVRHAAYAPPAASGAAATA